MGTQITEHFFEHNGRKYFRGKAEDAELASYGQKKAELSKDPYLAIQNKVKSEHLTGRVNGVGSVAVAWDTTSKADIGARGFLNVFGVKGERAVEMSYDEAKKGKVKLVGFTIDEGKLRTTLNTEADGARKYLESEGKDGRIVSKAWVAMLAEMADSFSASVGYRVSANVQGIGLDIIAEGGTKGSQKITLSKGTMFAYGLHKVKDWNKGKTKIENLEDDFYGMT